MQVSQSRFSVDQTATVLALLGFVPFAFFTAILLADPNPVPRQTVVYGGIAAFLIVAFKVYAAVVLSFIGGIRWGAAIVREEGGRRENRALMLSVAPSLIGWGSFFIREPWSFGLLAAAYAGTGWWDSRNPAEAGVPGWFGRLRVLLTVLVMATMIAAFVATYRSA